MLRGAGLSGLCALLLGACSTSGSGVVASYNGGTVTRHELSSWSEVNKPGKGSASLSPEAAVESFVLQQVLSRMALDKGLDDDPAVRFRLEDAEAAALENAFRAHLASTVEVSQEQLERRYQELYHRFNRPRTVRLLNIYKRYPPGLDDQGRALVAREMERIRKSVVEGADFAEMAREHSDSQTRFRGGVIGYVAAGELAPAVDAVAMRLAPGEVSEIITTEDGLTLLKCDAVEEATATSFEDARAVLERGLRARECDRLWADFERGVIDALDLEVDWEKLEEDGVLDEAVVVRSEQGSMSRAAAKQLIARSSAAPGTQAARKAFEQHAVRTAAVVRATELGLDRQTDVVNRIRWGRVRLLAGEMLRVLVEERFTPATEEEMRAHWNSNRQDYRQQPRYALTVIRLQADTDHPRDSWLAAQALCDRIHAGDLDMDAAAERFSDREGGTTARVDRRHLATSPNLLAAIDRLEPGEISRVVEQDGWYWIVRLDGIEPERELSFDEARPRVDHDLGNERTRRLQQQIEDELLATAKVRVLRDLDATKEPTTAGGRNSTR